MQEKIRPVNARNPPPSLARIACADEVVHDRIAFARIGRIDVTWSTV